MIKTLKLGECELFFLKDGSFSVDCGAYYGIIPKTIWQKLIKSDELNRCEVPTCPLLVKTPHHKVLIDPGIGDKISNQLALVYNIKRAFTIEHSLAEIEITPDEIDVIIATHLHFNHIGAATKYNKNHEAVPVFKNATHYFQKAEWHDALYPNERTNGTYFLDNYVPLQKAHLVELIEGNNHIVPHIRVEMTGGHTRAHQAVFIDSDNFTIVYWGDLTPDVNHLPIAYVAANDLYPAQSMEKRREYYERALYERWMICLDHDDKHRVGYLTLHDNKYRFETIL